MKKKIGSSTVAFENPPVIFATASIVGQIEGEGPLKKYFDRIISDSNYGEDSWEKAESKFVRETIKLVMEKAEIEDDKIDYAFAGDLLNQCAASTFGLREHKIPFFGLFGACSTFGEALSLGAMAIDGGFADNVICSSGSHFCSAEKQFRFPLGMGGQRPQSTTRTVTGCGAAILTNTGAGPNITHITTGRIVDMGVRDSMNMGAAMAPAAADTIVQHFRDTGRKPSDYSVIATGDLGYGGRAILRKLLMDEGFDMMDNLTDCGIEIFDREKQDTHSGGSGCACSATTYCGYYNQLLSSSEIKSMLLVPTGALLSPTTSQQGESIPGVAHAVAIEMR